MQHEPRNGFWAFRSPRLLGEDHTSFVHQWGAHQTASQSQSFPSRCTSERNAMIWSVHLSACFVAWHSCRYCRRRSCIQVGFSIYVLFAVSLWLSHCFNFSGEESSSVSLYNPVNREMSGDVTVRLSAEENPSTDPTLFWSGTFYILVRYWWQTFDWCISCYFGTPIP